MTLQKAREILNENKHQGYADWEITGEAVSAPDCPFNFSAFEAVAVAREYLLKVWADWDLQEALGYLEEKNVTAKNAVIAVAEKLLREELER